jgi:hypothetical protein
MAKKERVAKAEYYIRGIDVESWRQMKIRCIKEDRKLSDTMRKLIEMYAKGKISIED